MAGKILTAVLPHVINTIVTGVVAYFVFRPTPHAQFYCDNYEGDAPFTIRCSDESSYATRVRWEFGDGSKGSSSDEVTHTYRKASAAPYVVTLAALGSATDRMQRNVTVRSAAAVPQAFSLSIEGQTSGAVERVTKACAVNFLNNDHPLLLGEHTRDFEMTCPSDPEYRIVEASFHATSQTRSSGPLVEINPDRTLARIRSRITSGPQVDRYRGWLRGEVRLTQERPSVGQDVTLVKDLKIRAFGRYELPSSIDLTSLKSVKLMANDGLAFTIAPDGVFVDKKLGAAFALEEQGGRLFLNIAATK